MIADSISARLQRSREILSKCISPNWLFCGVPCSVLEPWLQGISNVSLRTRIVCNEGEAVAYCAGLWLGGSTGVAFMQNSGLGNAINAITSLLQPFKIPVVFLIGWRGAGSSIDEPQHRLMGRISKPILQLCDVATFTKRDLETSPTMLSQIDASLTARRPCAVLLPKIAQAAADAGVVKARESLPLRMNSSKASMPRRARLSTTRVLELCSTECDPATVFVTTTGYASREMFALGDGANKFYMVGSMGHAGALGLGIAISSRLPVVVIDGDGALLMHLGTLATVGAMRGNTFIHIVLNNGIHESTGGQAVAGTRPVNFSAIAATLGYLNTWRCNTTHELLSALSVARQTTGTSLLDVQVSARIGKLPRVPDDLPAIALRLREYIIQAQNN